MWDFLNHLSDKGDKQCLTASNFNGCSREWGNEKETDQD